MQARDIRTDVDMNFYHASPTGIYGLLSKEYSSIVIEAAIIATRITCLIAGKWIAHSSFRNALTATTFLYSTLLALGIVLLTISYQTIKATRKAMLLNLFALK